MIAENPNRKGMLFVGTGNALLLHAGRRRELEAVEGGSAAGAGLLDRGAEAGARPGGLHLRPRTLHHGRHHAARAGRHGRRRPRPRAVQLVAPRPAYPRWLAAAGASDRATSLKAAPKNPRAARDPRFQRRSGQQAARTPPAAPGLNRVSWDLRYEAPRAGGAAHHSARESAHLGRAAIPGRRRRGRSRTGVWRRPKSGPVAAPGKYTVRLTVDGQTYTQPLEIVLPPDSHGTEADIRRRCGCNCKVRDDITTVSDMTNQIEWMRRQLEDARKTLAGQSGKEALIKNHGCLRQEDAGHGIPDLITRADALSDDKYYVEQYKLYLNLIWLYQEIGPGGGDVAGSADYGPTDTAQTLVAEFEKEIQSVQTLVRDLTEKELPAFNKSIEGSGIQPLKTTGAPPPTNPGGRGRGGSPLAANQTGR